MVPALAKLPGAEDGGYVWRAAVRDHPRGAHLIAPRLCQGMSLVRMKPPVTGCLTNGSSWLKAPVSRLFRRLNSPLRFSHRLQQHQSQCLPALRCDRL